MATVNELIRSLPSRVFYLGESYTLAWRVSPMDSRCLKICYQSDYDEVLSIYNDYFYVETEKHYAVYTILQMLLQHAPDILGHIWYQDQNVYNTVVNKMYDNSLVLYDYCVVNSPETGMVTYESRECI